MSNTKHESNNDVQLDLGFNPSSKEMPAASSMPFQEIKSKEISTVLPASAPEIKNTDVSDITYPYTISHVTGLESWTDGIIKLIDDLILEYQGYADHDTRFRIKTVIKKNPKYARIARYVRENINFFIIESKSKNPFYKIPITQKEMDLIDLVLSDSKRAMMLANLIAQRLH